MPSPGKAWCIRAIFEVLIGTKNSALLQGIVLAGFLLSSIPDQARAETLVIEASNDATLIEDASGLLANGSGPALFVGRTGQATGGVRRAMVRFDLAEALPARALIERVFLNLHLTPSNDRISQVAAHRLLEAWSEGPAFSSGGGGAASDIGDSTWLHTLYDYQFWTIAGGHYVAHASAKTLVGEADFYTWQGTPKLLADVRLWQHAPHRNFGWILVGDEETPRSVKRFDSRESPVPEFRPTLTIEYRMPGSQPN
jgi:hypothetical protein